MISSPLRAVNDAPLIVTATAFGSAGGISLRGAATSVMWRHSTDAIERAPASEWPGAAQAVDGVAGERRERSCPAHVPAAITGIVVRIGRLVMRAAKSSGNSVSAEWMGT